MRRRSWPRNLELLRWSGRDLWTLDQASLGVLITGATGSGKSTGPFNTILRSYLRAGFGGIFLVAKTDATAEYVALVKSEGRSHDLVVVRPDAPGQCFNFLTYEAQQRGSSKAILENLIQLLMQAVEVASRNYVGSRTDEFFESAMKQLLRMALSVTIFATGKADLQTVLEIVQTLPQSLAQAEEGDHLRSMQLLSAAEQKAGQERSHELLMARQYFTWEWPTLNDRTRSSISITLSVLIDSFMRYPLREMFMGELTVSPDLCLRGRILIIACPVKEYDVVGKIAGTLWKYSVQRAIERRPELVTLQPIESVRPVFIAADECQFWATSTDSLFQMTARSARGLTVYATQSIPNLYAEMGGSDTSKARVDSLLGNLQNRFACQNLDQVTNQWYAEAIGRIIVKRKGSSETVSYNGDQYSILARLAGSNRSINKSESEQLDYDLQPRAFTGLLRGGPQGKVEAILVSAGKRFQANGRRWLKVSFDQFQSPSRMRRFFSNPGVVITAPKIRS